MMRIGYQLISLSILVSVTLFPSLSAAQQSFGPFSVGSRPVFDIPVSGDIEFLSGTDGSGEEYLRPDQNTAVVYYPADPENRHEVAPEGAFPLIVYGHGMRSPADTCPDLDGVSFLSINTGDYLQLDAILRHLASWGFVVASVDLSWLTPTFPDLGGIADRRYALRDAADHMLRENFRDGSVFRNKIRTLRVGLMGHSMGADAAVFLGADAAVPLGADASNLLGPRVRAIGALSPPDHSGTSPLFDPEYNIAAFAPKPVILLQGTREWWYTSAPANPRASRLYAAAGPEKYLVTIADANHFGYTDDICAVGDLPDDIYSGLNGILARVDQQNIATAFLTAFFRLYLASECGTATLYDEVNDTTRFEGLEGFTIDLSSEAGGAPACIPLPDPDRFDELPLNNDVIEQAAVLSMGETSSLDQRIMADGEWPHVFETNESWEANAMDLNLHSSADQDFLSFRLPSLASYAGGDIDPSPSIIQPLIEHGTLERRSGLPGPGERGRDLLMFSGRLEISGVDTVRYGDRTTHVATAGHVFNNPQSELAGMMGEPIIISYGESAYGENEHDVVSNYDVLARYQINVLRVPQPTKAFLALAVEREVAGRLPCLGGFFPKCTNASFKKQLEVAHPQMKSLRDCSADGCPDYFVFVWEGSSAFDVKFAAMPAVSFKLLDLNLQQIAEAVQLPQLPSDGPQSLTAASFPSEQTVSKRLYVPKLAPGFYVLVASGPRASYDINFVSPPPAADSDGDGIGDWVDSCPLVANSSQADTDYDGVGDACDKCILQANSTQLDADHDGYGNACDPDLNQDGIVNFVDLAAMKKVFFKADPVADLNGDGVVNFVDLAIMKKSFFKPPGPAAGKP